MIYILDQRLKAQNVTHSKSEKVVQDIVGQMFDAKCVKELFRPQKVLSMKSLRIIFSKLAHSSIMKLNDAAMDKLCDLMVMAAKYQMLMCRRGEDIILVTLNHLDTIRKLVGESEHHLGLIDSSIRTLTDFYSRLSASEFILLRSTLLLVFQDTHKRVSIFLKNGSQNSNGRFCIPTGGPVPNGFDIPGTIRYYDGHGEVKSETKFDVPFKYELPEPPGSWALHGDRVISLGSNMFALEKTATDTSGRAQEEKQEKDNPAQSELVITAELKLLEKLLGNIRPPGSDSHDNIKIIWFTDGEDDENIGSAEEKPKLKDKVLKIDASKRDNVLQGIAKDFDPKQFGDVTKVEDDLLDLMDSTY